MAREEASAALATAADAAATVATAAAAAMLAAQAATAAKAAAMAVKAAAATWAATATLRRSHHLCQSRWCHCHPPWRRKALPPLPLLSRQPQAPARASAS